MTREEAIERIQKLIGRFKSDSRTYKALEMAIQALSQEPCDDAISRAELLKAISTWDKFGVDDTNSLFRLDNLSLPHYVPYIHYDDVIKCIKGMPSVTQKSETVTEFADRCRECGARYGKMLEQKSGKWDRSCTCSVCGKWRILESEKNGGKYKYCPNCGAKMESGDK